MRAKAGLWIDHKRAVVVLITATGEELKQIASNAEKQLRRTGSTPLQGNFEAQQVPADGRRQRIFTGQLDAYYDEVIACIGDAEAILIFGPGEAKNQLKDRLEDKSLAACVVETETEDIMTEPQIAAKVRRHFGG